MKMRRFKVWEAALLQAVVFTSVAFLIGSCAPPAETGVPARVELVDNSVTILGRLPYQEVVRIEDKERGVVCYAYRDFESTALDCMPDFNLRY